MHLVWVIVHAIHFNIAFSTSLAIRCYSMIFTETVFCKRETHAKCLHSFWTSVYSGLCSFCDYPPTGSSCCYAKRMLKEYKMFEWNWNWQPRSLINHHGVDTPIHTVHRVATKVTICVRPKTICDCVNCRRRCDHTANITGDPVTVAKSAVTVWLFL